MWVVTDKPFFELTVDTVANADANGDGDGKIDTTADAHANDGLSMTFTSLEI